MALSTFIMGGSVQLQRVNANGLASFKPPHLLCRLVVLACGWRNTASASNSRSGKAPHFAEETALATLPAHGKKLGILHSNGGSALPLGHSSVTSLAAGTEY